MDQLARRLTMDPAELRRRNFIRAFPYRTPTGRTYDSGNYEAALDKALAAIRYDEVRAAQRRRRSGDAGVPLGVGVACYVERSGGPPDTDEFGSVEVEPDGSVIARSGSTCSGQGHPTAFPQVVATALDIALDRVRLVQNDTREVPYGFATFGSRSMQVGGGALWRASCQLVEEARQRFATACEVDAGSVSYAGGWLGTPAGQSVTLGELVEQTGPLRAEDRFKPPQAFPFGCYAAAVEVDTDLGNVRILRLVAVDDYGVVVNPMLVDGQGYGSIAQGLGQALYEEAAYTPAWPSRSRQPARVPAADRGRHAPGRAAGDRDAEPEQPLRQQRGRGGRVHRRAACGGQRGLRRARRRPYRHAPDTGNRLARRPPGGLTFRYWFLPGPGGGGLHGRDGGCLHGQRCIQHYCEGA